MFLWDFKQVLSKLQNTNFYPNKIILTQIYIFTESFDCFKIVL